jgi:tetratricopeptide (TPR) repeat protein
MWKFLTSLFIMTITLPAYGQAVSTFGHTEGQQCYLETKGGASPSAAIDTCTAALKTGMTSHDRAYTLINRSINFNQTGQYSQALDDIDAAFEIVPELAEAYLSRGNNHILQGQYDEAIEDYSQAIDLGVQDEHKAYFNRAVAYEALKNYSLAYDDYVAATNHSPGFVPAIERVTLYREEFKTADWMTL